MTDPNHIDSPKQPDTHLLALDPFTRDSSSIRQGSLPDIGSLPTALNNKAIERAIDWYRAYSYNEDPDGHDDSLTLEDIDTNRLVLSPLEIQTAYSLIITGIDEDRLNMEDLGGYITRLIQDSFVYGRYNDFKFDPKEMSITNLGSRLIGHKKMRLALTHEGDASYCIAESCKFVRIMFNGDVGSWSATNAEKSVIEVMGYVGDAFAYGAYRSTFTLHGRAGTDCGNKSSECVFNVYNEKLFKQLKAENTIRNKINLLDTYGNIVEKTKGVIDNGRW